MHERKGEHVPSTFFTKGAYISTATFYSLVRIIRRIARTPYVDAVYCYRPSSVVCRSVCQNVTLVNSAKTPESIDMPVCKVLGHSAVTCVKTTEPIVMPFGLWARTGPRNHKLGGCLKYAGTPGQTPGQFGSAVRRRDSRRDRFATPGQMSGQIVSAWPDVCLSIRKGRRQVR